MESEQKKSLISEIDHDLVPQLIHAVQHVRHHGSHHDDGHPQPVDHVGAGDAPWFIPLTPVEQVRVDVGEPEAGHVKTHDDVLTVEILKYSLIFCYLTLTLIISMLLSHT